MYNKLQENGKLVPDEKGYCKILGISPGVSADEIKEAYIYEVNILPPDRLVGGVRPNTQFS